MSFFKYRIMISLVLFACFLAVPSVMAQNLSIVQSDSGDSFLGITMEDVTISNLSEYKLTDERGVIVRSVLAGSPAEDAMLRENDVIVEFAGEHVWSSRQLSRLVSETPVGRKTAIAVSRDGKRVNLSATIGERTDRNTGNRPGRENLQRGELYEAIPGGKIERFFGFSPRSDTQDGRQDDERLETRQLRPWLGLEMQPLTEQMAEFLGIDVKKGVLITSVLNGSVSEGRLKAGDVVVDVNNREVARPEDVTRIFAQQSTSGEVTVAVIRNKKRISVKISLSSDGNQKGGGYRL